MIGSEEAEEEKIYPSSLTEVASEIHRANERTVFSNFPAVVAQLIKEQNYYPLLLLISQQIPVIVMQIDFVCTTLL